MRRSLALALTLLALSLVSFPTRGAQAQGPKDLSVRTFPLQNLSPSDAAKLVSPYVMGLLPTGGVFEAGGAVSAITVRATPEIIVRIDSLLRANDHPRATIVLRFQVIAASDSTLHDASIAAIETELRSLFRFAGYRMLSQGAAIVSAPETFSITMPGSRGDMFSLEGMVEAVQIVGGKGSARLRVALKSKSPISVGQIVQYQVAEIFSTGLTVPLGQTAVLGTAATTSGGIPALILVVKPDLRPKP